MCFICVPKLPLIMWDEVWMIFLFLQRKMLWHLIKYWDVVIVVWVWIIFFKGSSSKCSVPDDGTICQSSANFSRCHLNELYRMWRCKPNKSFHFQLALVMVFCCSNGTLCKKSENPRCLVCFYSSRKWRTAFTMLPSWRCSAQVYWPSTTD